MRIVKIRNRFCVFISCFGILPALPSCKREAAIMRFQGQVIRQLPSCTSSAGHPFVVSFLKEATVDSLITITLPSQYQVVGLKISFEQRDPQTQEERLICTSLYKTPVQKVIRNVQISN
jgi:hypothetical protein